MNPRGTRGDIMSSQTMHELVKLLGVWQMGPMHNSRTVFRLECRIEFEPHGRASETWEPLWILTLPHIRRYEAKIKPDEISAVQRQPRGARPEQMQWVPVMRYPDCMTFRGRDDLECLQRAVAFLRAVPNPIELGGEIPTAAADATQQTYQLDE